MSSLDVHLLVFLVPTLGQDKPEERGESVDNVLDQLRGTVEDSLLGVRWGQSVQSKC